MRERNGRRICRLCGREVETIPWGEGRNTTVDPEPCWVVPDPEGEQFVRIDGSKIRGRNVGITGGSGAEPAYRMHRITCGRVRL